MRVDTKYEYGQRVWIMYPDPSGTKVTGPHEIVAVDFGAIDHHGRRTPTSYRVRDESHDEGDGRRYARESHLFATRPTRDDLREALLQDVPEGCRGKKDQEEAFLSAVMPEVYA